MTLLIREARPDDAAELSLLLVELGYRENEVDGVRERVDAWSHERNHRLFVAELEGRLVGAAALACVPYFERAGSCGRLVALVVAADARRQGVARRLVDTAEAAARDSGCIVMEVTSARNRTASHAFYKSIGYEDWCDRSARYLKDLVPGATAGSYGARPRS